MKIKNKSYTLPLIFGIVYAAIYIIVRIREGNGYDFLHKISGVELFSPLWLFSLFSTVAFFFGGFYLGIEIREATESISRCNQKADIYRGGILFTIVFFLSLMWYPTLFVRESVVLGFFVALICFVLCLSVLYIWGRINPVGILFGGLFSIFWLYVTVLNFLLIFKI